MLIFIPISRLGCRNNLANQKTVLSASLVQCEPGERSRPSIRAHYWVLSPGEWPGGHLFLSQFFSSLRCNIRYDDIFNPSKTKSSDDCIICVLSFTPVCISTCYWHRCLYCFFCIANVLLLLRL